MLQNVSRALGLASALPLLLVGCRTSAVPLSVSAPARNVETVEEHWPDGKVRLRRQVRRSPDGTLQDHGRYERWYNNGQKEYEATMVAGRKNGVVTFWHRNGRKWIEEHYLDGRRDGIRRVWDDLGRKRKEERFLLGKPHGIWTTWGEDGEIRWQHSFDHGVAQP